MKTALITGITGQDGSYLAEFLLKKGYQAVERRQVSAILKEQGHDIERRTIEVEEPIRSLGVYNISVRLHASVTATIKLWVVKDD